MDRRPTRVDYSELQWWWPSWKFNLPITDLFGNLFDQYNKIEIAIQEPIAFHHDVLEISSTATTRDEFYTLLKERRKQRIQELQECWSSVAIGIAANPPLLEGDPDKASIVERWAAFLHFSREFSFDALARYFSLFTHKTRSSPALHLPTSSGSSTNPPPASQTTSSASTDNNNDEDGGRVKKIRTTEDEQPGNSGRTLGGMRPAERRSGESGPAVPLLAKGTRDLRPVRRSSRIAARRQVSGHGTQKNPYGAIKGRTDSETTKEALTGQRRQRKVRRRLDDGSKV